MILSMAGVLGETPCMLQACQSLLAQQTLQTGRSRAPERKR